jgi:hypothetical protein
MLARTQLRRRRVATVGLILLVGIAGGVVLTAIAGASRTDTAMDRFVAYNRPVDLAVVVDDPALRPKVTALPQVVNAGQSVYMFLSPSKNGSDLGALSVFAVLGDTMRAVRRPIMLSGRLPRSAAPLEATVNEQAARNHHLHVGSHVTTWAYSADQMLSAAATGFGNIGAPKGPQYTFRVVGVIREPSDVNSVPAAVIRDAFYVDNESVTTTPAFLRRYAADLGFGSVEAVPGTEFVAVRLRHGTADMPAFQREVRQLLGPRTPVLSGSDTDDAHRRVGQATHLEAIALLVFAALVGLAALVLIGQALSRQVAFDAVDHPTLAALGLSRFQRAAVPMIRAVLVAVAGALLAVALAVALSPFTPIGLARHAEIHPGVSVNVAVLAAGFLAVVIIVVARAFLPAWRTATTRRDDALARSPVRPGPLSTVVANARLGAAAVTGIGMSLERGRSAAFRTALVGTVVAVAGVVAAFTFGDSLRHLVDTPREQGWTWDVVVGNPNGQPTSPDSIRDQMAPKLAANRRVAAFSGLAFANGLTVDGRAVDLAGIQPIEGSVFATLIAGHAPLRPDELVLGRDTLHELRRRVGQTVTVAAGNRHATMRVVGESLIPTAGDLTASLGSGGAATVDGIRRLQPDAAVLEFLVRFKAGADHRAAESSLRREFGRVVLLPYPGGEVGDLARIDSLPYVLAAMLVVFAIGALALTLSSSVRRHRRDLAILKTIGFARRNVSATVAWQATTLAVAAVVIGVPAGIALGRWTWQLVADGVSSVSPAVVPLTVVLLAVPATVLLANVLASGPAWIAGRIRPADALRAE